MPRSMPPAIDEEQALANVLDRMVEQIARGPAAGSVDSTDPTFEDRSRTPIRVATDANGNLVGIYGIGSYGTATYAGND